METKSVKKDDNKVELSVTLDKDVVQKQVDAAYKQAGKVRIPGFRPGKAPRKVLDNFYGGKEYFLVEATDALLKETLPMAVDEANLVPLDRPEVGELDSVKEGESYTYTVSFTVRPEYELSSYEPVQIELPAEEPTPEEIAEQVDVMLSYYVDIQEVTGRGVKDGDVATMDIELTSDGQRVEEMSGEKIPYMLGGGAMPASFDAKLIGIKPGKTVEFDLEFAEGEELPSFLSESKPAHAKLTISSIQERVKPELTDEFAKDKLEFESAEDFKTQVAESLRFRKSSELASLKESLIGEELASRLEGEPTELLLSLSEQDIYRDFFNSLQQSGQSFDSFLAGAGITPDTFREDIKKQATEMAKQALALDAWARHFAIEVGEEDIKHEFEASGAEDPEALFEQWRENGRLAEIRDGVLRMKASKQVSEGAEVLAPGKKPAAKKAAAKKPAAKKAAAKKDGKDADAGDKAASAKAAKDDKDAGAKAASAKAAKKDSAKDAKK